MPLAAFKQNTEHLRVKRRYRKHVPREPRESPKLRRLRTKFAILEWFIKLDGPFQIVSREQVGRDHIVKTNHGNFRVNRKGHITGPFKNEPLPFSRAAILYNRTDGQ